MYVGLRLDYLPWLFLLWLLVCYFQVKVESEVLVFVRKGWGRWVGELGENQLGKDKLSTKNSIHLYHTSGQEIALWAQRCEVPVRVLTTGPKAVTQINCELLLFFFYLSFQSCNNMEPVEVDTAASIRISGSMCCQAYVHQKATAGEAVQVHW